MSRKDPEAFRKDLLAIARTTLSSKVLAADKDYFAELAVSAVLRLKVRDIISYCTSDGGELITDATTTRAQPIWNTFKSLKSREVN